MADHGCFWPNNTYQVSSIFRQSKFFAGCFRYFEYVSIMPTQSPVTKEASLDTLRAHRFLPSQGLVTEEELLKLIPMTSRVLKELRYRRKIPFYAPTYRIRLYDVEVVKKSLATVIVNTMDQPPSNDIGKSVRQMTQPP